MNNENNEFALIQWNSRNETLFTSLSYLRDSELYTDVIVNCEDSFYPAHRLILNLSSQYFARAFQILPKNGYPVFILCGIQKRIFEAILSYIYEGKVTIDSKDVAIFMKAGIYLEIAGLVKIGENLQTNEVSCLGQNVNHRKVKKEIGVEEELVDLSSNSRFETENDDVDILTPIDVDSGHFPQESILKNNASFPVEISSKIATEIPSSYTSRDLATATELNKYTTAQMTNVNKNINCCEKQKSTNFISNLVETIKSNLEQSSSKNEENRCGSNNIAKKRTRSYCCKCCNINFVCIRALNRHYRQMKIGNNVRIIRYSNDKGGKDGLNASTDKKLNGDNIAYRLSEEIVYSNVTTVPENICVGDQDFTDNKKIVIPLGEESVVNTCLVSEGKSIVELSKNSSTVKLSQSTHDNFVKAKLQDESFKNPVPKRKKICSNICDRRDSPDSDDDCKSNSQFTNSKWFSGFDNNKNTESDSVGYKSILSTENGSFGFSISEIVSLKNETTLTNWIKYKPLIKDDVSPAISVRNDILEKPFDENLVGTAIQNVEEKLCEKEIDNSPSSIETGNYCDSENTVIKCDICSRVYLSISSYKKHKQVDCKILECPFCYRTYANNEKQMLDDHLKTHLDQDKPFACPECSYRTNKSRIMHDHISIHKGIFRFWCPLCNFKAKTIIELQTHNECHHKDIKMYD